MFNKVTLIGHLGQKPKARRTIKEHVTLNIATRCSPTRLVSENEFWIYKNQLR